LVNDIQSQSFHFDNKPAKINGKKSTMIDFRKTMFSRIESNTLRGKIGEYIVSWAIGAEETSQDPWQAFDLISPHSKKIEVKTTSFLQDWEHGEKNRNPKFIIKPTRKYTRASGLEKERTYNADIYVLCYYSWLDKKTIDVLNLNHWKFWVFSKNELLEVFNGNYSITVKKLEKKGHYPITAQELKQTILSK